MISARDSVRVERQGMVLQAFSRALTREAHVLKDYPNLMWQQLYNHLQWDGESVVAALEPEFNRRCVPGSRPWIWIHNRGNESRGLVRTLEGHKGGVESCAFSPDGRWIVSASGDNTLKIWDAATGAEWASLIGHTENVRDCAYSPDGRFIVSASWDKTVRIWDADTGTLRRTLETKASNCCAVSQDNRRIISVGLGNLCVWDAESGRKLYALEDIHARFLSKDGVYCVSVEDTTPEYFRNIQPATKGRLHGPGYLTVTIWNVDTKSERTQLRFRLKSQGINIVSIDFSPDGSTLVTAHRGPSRTVRIWDADSGKCLRRLNNRKFHVNACRFSPDSRWLAISGFSASDDRKFEPAVQLWDADRGKHLTTFKGHVRKIARLATDINALDFSPDGRRILSGADDHTLRIWDPASAHGGEDQQGFPTLVTSCGFSMDGNRMVTAGGKAITLWDASCDEILHSWKQDPIQDCALNRDGSKIVTLNVRNKFLNKYDQKFSVNIWDATSGRKIRMLRGSSHRLVYRCGGFSPDGNKIITAGYGPYNDNVVLWNAAKGREVRTLEGTCKYMQDICFSPDGRWALSAGSASHHDLRLWEVSTGKIIRDFSGHQDRVQSCAFSPDGAWIVSGCWDGTIKIWDLSSGQELRSLVGHIGKVNFCAISPDGNWIISGGEDQTIRLWRVSDGQQVSFLPQLNVINVGAIHPQKNKAVLCDAVGTMLQVEMMPRPDHGY